MKFILLLLSFSPQIFIIPSSVVKAILQSNKPIILIIGLFSSKIFCCTINSFEICIHITILQSIDPETILESFNSIKELIGLL